MIPQNNTVGGAENQKPVEAGDDSFLRAHVNCGRW